MDTQKTIIYYVYSTLLDRLEIDYTEEGPWLIHGNPLNENTWLIYITSKVSLTASILKNVLPIIKKNDIPFRLIKNDEDHYKLHSGDQGTESVGKFMTLYCTSLEMAEKIISEIELVTNHYLGPEIPYSFRVSKNIYLQYARICDEIVDGELTKLIRFENPKRDLLPSKNKKEFVARKTRPIFGNYYIRTKVLRPGPKGEIFQAISLKKLALKYVVIKEGKFAVLQDTSGRDIKDRFLWQKKVLLEIGTQIPTAKFLDYFEDHMNSYLVIENLDGKLLSAKLSELKDGLNWAQLEQEAKIKIISYYLQIILIVKKIHSLGYVHRDIQDCNFIVDPKDEINIIDFELSYSLKRDEPKEPFLMGTYGYASPEQIAYDPPSTQADIYSLGALLSFIISGEHPSTLIPEDYGELSQKISKYSDHKKLTNMITTCLNPDPILRMKIEMLEKETLEYLESQKIINKNIGSL